MSNDPDYEATQKRRREAARARARDHRASGEGGPSRGAPAPLAPEGFDAATALAWADQLLFPRTPDEQPDPGRAQIHHDLCNWIRTAVAWARIVRRPLTAAEIAHGQSLATPAGRAAKIDGASAPSSPEGIDALSLLDEAGRSLATIAMLGWLSPQGEAGVKALATRCLDASRSKRA